MSGTVLSVHDTDGTKERAGPWPARSADRSSGAFRTRPAATPDEEPVPLAIVGCDFRVASTAWRNRLMLDATERAALTAALRTSCSAQGVVVVETCNRIEWIVAAPSPQWAAEVMRAQMLERWLRAGLGRPANLPYLHVGGAAVQHLLRVAVGLQSFVVGEREIAGQLNRALVQARTDGHASIWHNALQTAVGRTVRKVQRFTKLRHAARGVHGLALDAVRRQVPPLPDRRRLVAVVGMGEIGRKTAGLLEAAGGYTVLRCNRTVPAERVGDWQGLDALPGLLQQVEAVIVATGAATPVVQIKGLPRTPRDVGRLTEQREGRRPGERLLVVDLGTPAQVTVAPGEPAVLLGLDELLAEPTHAPDRADLQRVHELVDEGVSEFLIECRKRDLASLLRAAHDAYEHLAYEELPGFLEAELGDALDPERRRKLQAGLRDLLRNHARELVQHIEDAAGARSRDE